MESSRIPRRVIAILTPILVMACYYWHSDTMAPQYHHPHQKRPVSSSVSRSLKESAAYKSYPPFPTRYYLEPVVDVPLPKYACFLACVQPKPSNPDLTCHFREHIRKQVLGRIVLDGKNLRIKSPILWDIQPAAGKKAFYAKDTPSVTTGTDVMGGEDPRSFMLNGNVYVMNNILGQNTLIRMADDVSQNESVDLPKFLGLKNTTPIPLSKDEIMFIDMQLEKIHTCRIDTTPGRMALTNCAQLKRDVKWIYKNTPGLHPVETWHHRGGTPGVQISSSKYVGFGHTTERGFAGHHDIFSWKLDLGAYVMEIDYTGVPDGLDRAITDPTSLVPLNGEWLLMTAESEETWGRNKPIVINRIYSIRPM